MNEAIDALLRQRSDIWLGRRATTALVEASGHIELDAVLIGGGWPVGALTELIPLAEGIGELRLLMPALRRICNENRFVILIRPPHIPYAPALARMGLPLDKLLWINPEQEREAHWAAEQALREGSVGAVLLWTRTDSTIVLRRLQLAAAEGCSLAFVYRPHVCLRNASPAALRLVLRPAMHALYVEVIKVRGGHSGVTVLCPLQ